MQMLMRFCLFSLPALLVLLSAYADAPIPIGPAKVDPRLQWHTLETEHFSIHFHQGGETLARRTASLAERIHGRLTREMQWIPKGKTHIVINDSVDIVNGVATPVLYNQIFIYPTQPVLGLGHFDDWLESLLVHEYTHILDIGRVEGFSKGVQAVLGKFWFPKALTSTLFTEGYATYNETHYTDGGRGRDPYTDMFLRESFLAGDVPRLDQLLWWGIYPGGSQPYTYGSAFFHFMAEKLDENSPHTFQRNLTGDLWPWNADNAARISTLRSLRGFWEEWKSESTRRYQRQDAMIQQKGLTVSRPLTDSKSAKWSPVWSATGEILYYFSASTNSHPEIRQIDLQTRRDRSVTRLHTLTDETGLTLSPDGTQLAFSQIAFQRNFSVYNELFLQDVRRGKTTRLTHGGRLKDPAWHPDGESILAVKSEGGNTHLVSINLQSKQVRPLNPETTGLQFSEPSWAPDGNTFAVSAWGEGGYQDIWIFEAEGEQGYPLLRDKAWHISPCWTPDGKYVLFASDRTGVYNLFAYQFQTGQLHQVTNVRGGAFDPEVSPDGTQLAFVSYAKDGFNIHTMEFAPEAWKPVRGTHITDLSPYPFFVGYRTDAQTPDDATKPEIEKNPTPPYRIRSYSSLSTLLPRFWLPYPTVDESGGAIAAITAGRDLLGKHTYVLSAQYGVASKQPGYLFQYINDQFYPSLGLMFQDMPEILQYQSRSSDDLFTWHRSRYAAAQIYLPYITAGSQQGFSLGIEAEKSTFQNWPRDVQLPFTGQLVNAFAGWNFSNTHRYPRAISRTNGVELSLIYREYLTRLGSDANLSEISVDAAAYLGLPLERHVLAWKGSLAYNNTDFPKFHPQFDSLALRSFDDLYVGNLLFSTGEYRFPIFEIRRGWQILPVFFEQLHGAVFVDFIHSLSSPLNDPFAIGGEIRLDGTAGYFLRSTLRLSFAVRLRRESTPRIWIQVGETF